MPRQPACHAAVQPNISQHAGPPSGWSSWSICVACSNAIPTSTPLLTRAIASDMPPAFAIATRLPSLRVKSRSSAHARSLASAEPAVVRYTAPHCTVPRRAALCMRVCMPVRNELMRRLISAALARRDASSCCTAVAAAMLATLQPAAVAEASSSCASPPPSGSPCPFSPVRAIFAQAPLVQHV